MADLATMPEAGIGAMAETLCRRCPGADALYIPAPHWAVIGLIERLERSLGIPVVTAIQAIVWEALRRSGVEDRIEGYGRLLQEC